MIEIVPKEDIQNDSVIKEVSNGLSIIIDENGNIDVFEYENGNRTKKFKFNKLYIEFYFNNIGYSFQTHFYYKGTDRGIQVTRHIPEDTSVDKNEQVLTREEIETLFNPVNYDAFYIIDSTVGIISAYNKKDGHLKERNIIPTDEEIIKRDYAERKFNYNFFVAMFGRRDQEDNLEPIRERSIDEITNLKILVPLLRTFSDILVTVKDGVISASWFSIFFLSKDKFKLIRRQIDLDVPSLDDIFEYFKREEKRKEEERLAEEQRKEEESKKTGLMNIFKRRNNGFRKNTDK